MKEYRWMTWGVAAFVMLVLWTGLRADLASRDDAGNMQATAVIAMVPANGDDGEAKRNDGEAKRNDGEAKRNDGETKNDAASTVTFTGLTDAMELSQQLIEALPGVVETEMDTEAGVATVKTDGARFCPHTALTLLRAHGIDAAIDGQEKVTPKKPSGSGCPYENQRMMEGVRNI